MGSNEKFCLRWNDFESNISVAFREIREEKDFFDITLSCGSRQIQAHKLILSACSPFFRTVLKQNPHQHPLLYLKGVEFNNLQSVLNFMYHGEVNVAQEELNSFLSVAEELQVKGLTQNSPTTNPNTKTEPQPTRPRAPPPETTPKRTRPSPLAPPPVAPAPRQASYPPPESDDIQEIIPMPVVKTEPQPAPTAVTTPEVFGLSGEESQGHMVTDVANMEEGYDDYGEYEGQGYDGGEGQGYGGGDGQGYAEQGYGGDGVVGQQRDTSNYVLISESGVYGCSVCGKEFGVQSNCRRHVREKHLGGEQENCPVCNKIICKRNMQRHVKICSLQK